MIFDATQCQLGEGPLWHPTRKDLFWFDILGKRLHNASQQWDFETYVSAAGWVDQDRLFIASATALSLFEITTGTLDMICPLEAENPITRSNDGRADPQGGFWIGTMGINAEPGAGAIYRYYRGELRRLYDNITVSNAICFGPAGDIAYFTDTDTQIIYMVTLDADGWPNGDPAPFVDLRGTDYRPDGAVVDTQGNLWNAQWGAARIAVYDPTGTYITDFDVPGKQSTCPAFGGPDLTTLFCTSAAVGLDGPHEGQTFSQDTSYIGQAEHRVIL